MLTNKIYKHTFFLVLISVFLFLGCEDFLNEQPQDEVSEEAFWNDEKDAMKGLMGVYERLNAGGITFDGWVVNTVYFDYWTDIGISIRNSHAANYPWAEGILPTNSQVSVMWRIHYQKIGRANYFLANIEEVEMDEDIKAEMIAEARFLRAYSYFWLSQLFGNIPLITETLNFEEANSATQTSQEEVVDFTLSELTETIEDLPVQRPASEKGRIEKGAALAMKGRLLMAEERWSEAAETYKTIMDLDRYEIDPRFKKLFEDEGNNSNEIILSTIYTEVEDGHRISQLVNWPSNFGSNNGFQFYQEFVDKFLMEDGNPIDESSLYDSDNPFENRDPRLYQTVLLPSYSTVDGKVYIGHPDTVAQYGQFGPGHTGYMMNKFHDREYDGNKTQYGGDYYLIRYAEVLLSRLESELEAGRVINQELLDQTINLIRSREEVDMPPVTETNPEELRKIIKRERVVELAGEGGIRYWDLLRREELHEILNQSFHGMKITNNPDEYDGGYIINDEGHLIKNSKPFSDHNYLWPIPLNELDVNNNLEQNPGY